MGQLGEDHRAEVAEHRITPCFGIHTSLLGCPINDVTRNELEYLPKNIDVMTGWLSGVSMLILTPHSKSSR